ncbi:hypothetical protein ACLMAJ_31045 [Nocardia sp. KC 131]|uniref:hypothetical protein n=1 Tax=Nocardia arseniciresistens TaxID=3392119 RepID=UPI00398EC062
MNDTLVDEYGTGLLRTVISADQDGYVWRRTPGLWAPAPFASIEHSGLALGEIENARMVFGGTGDSRIYRGVRDHRSAASLLAEPATPTELRSALRGTGALLRAMHENPAPTSDPPKAVVRLRHWLSGRARTPRAAYAEQRLSGALGAARMVLLNSWCVDLLTASEMVLSHGAPGLGVIVPDAERDGVDLLSGEDFGGAPWYFDVGWLLGELCEMHLAELIDADSFGALHDALIEGYGRDLDVDWNRMVVLRILLRLHDSIAYVGWNPGRFAQTAGLLRYLIDRSVL